MKKFYITTPLYYVNDLPHIGHAYSTVGADVLARFMRARGREVVLQTGTDEHGLKVEKAAQEKGAASPQAFADAIVEGFKRAWTALGIHYDRFLRTTDGHHKAAAQEFWRRVEANGHIDKRAYEGWYCVHEEVFHLEKDLLQPGNLCPECSRPATRMKEENYFFKLTRFAPELLAEIKADPGRVVPDARRNEVLGSYLEAEGGVQDISISRSALKWGIPVPSDPSHVIYVWFDALINYISGAGWPDEPERFAGEWPADVHIIGKEILRQHAVLWPAMLKAAGLPTPTKVFGTGWIVNDGKKMSKSLGNVIDPIDWAGRFGAEVVRYYLLRDVPFGNDASISEAGLEGRYNAELANGLGNLISRSSALCEKNGVVFAPWAGPSLPSDAELLAAAAALKAAYLPAMEALAFHDALEAVNVLIRAANKYVDESAPWTLAKDKTPEGQVRLAHALYAVAEAARLCLCALAPFMPKTADKGLAALGYAPGAVFGPRTENAGAALDALLDWGRLPAGLGLKKGEGLFPRREAAAKA